MSDENLPHAVLLAVHQICEDKWQAVVSAQHQTIGFGPLCESEEECQWWADQFRTALSRVGARFVLPEHLDEKAE
jgi:hypothetical protein